MRTTLWIAALAAAGASAQTPPEGTLRTIVVTPTQGVAQDAFDTPASVDVMLPFSVAIWLASELI